MLAVSALIMIRLDAMDVTEKETAPTRETPRPSNLGDLHGESNSVQSPVSRIIARIMDPESTRRAA